MKNRLIELLRKSGASFENALPEEIADHLLANDVVKVVRCKDCKYFEIKNSLATQGICKCGEIETNYGGEFYPLATDFCSYGELRELGK